MNRSWLSVPALLGIALAGCSLGDAHMSQTAEPGVVSGSVTYRERMTLPSDAVVEVWIADVSPLGYAVPVIAQGTVLPKGRQLPIPFELRYDLGRIERDHDYAVNAAIRSAGKILLASRGESRVITKGHPTQVELLLVRASGESGVAETPGGATTGLHGTAWRLVDLTGAALLESVEATLEFPEPGKVTGNGSCNRFSGTVEISGESIRIGQLESTCMGCEEAVMNQEAKYLAALRQAERFTLEGPALLIHTGGAGQPLRFIRQDS